MNTKKRKAPKEDISSFRDKMTSKKEKIIKQSENFMKISDFFKKEQINKENTLSQTKQSKDSYFLKKTGDRDKIEKSLDIKQESQTINKFHFDMNKKGKVKELEKIIFPIFLKTSIGFKKGESEGSISKICLLEDEYAKLKLVTTNDNINLFYEDYLIG
jgi:hypothetical protein